VFEEAMREEDVPAQQPEAEEEARLPAPDAHSRRSSGHRPPAVKGSRPPLRLIWRIRDRASFRALAGGRRRRQGVLVVTVAALPAAGNPPRVAYALDRRLGPAVTRNAVRRRLRAAVREQRDGLEPDHAYLIRALPGSADRSYRELSDTLRDLLAELTHEER
jgi:ribonuclease P protein component